MRLWINFREGEKGFLVHAEGVDGAVAENCTLIVRLIVENFGFGFLSIEGCFETFCLDLVFRFRTFGELFAEDKGVDNPGASAVRGEFG
mmetsp:Transcript_19022/g.30255  ORF Transcript_19022/g.30255 Transcript_19022/m.30255 type:complete len:89 (-) Transcript_19022:1506-1772(-)